MRYKSFAEFWPFYLGEHRKPATRALHLAGTALALQVVLLALLLEPWLWLVVPLAGYGLAWLAHFGVEKNRPATFTYPLWSLKGDLLMFWLFVTGRLQSELERHHISPAPPAPPPS